MIVQASMKDIDEMLSIINLSNKLSFKKLIPKKYFQEPILNREKLIEEFLKISFFIFKSHKRILGVIGLDIQNSEKGIVRWVYIHPDYQNRGIGTALLAHIEQIAIDAKLKKLYLRTEEKADWAISFYRANGFSITKKIEVPWGFNVLMVKSLMDE